MNSEETIFFVDKDGNRYAYSRQDWVEKILPNELVKAWMNPDLLYDTIVTCLKQEIYSRLVDPVLQLIKIDYDLSRAYVIAGIVFLKNNKLKDAEQILKEGISRFPNEAVLHINLAKVHASKGDTQLSYNTLWNGLMLDPNQENGLNWIGAIHFEKEGQEGKNKIYEQIAMLPNSWRSQLFIARNYLECGDINKAKKIYVEILSKAADEADVVMMIAGDLGKNNKIEEIFEIVYPFFDLGKHGISSGLNIVQACILSKRKETGIEILSEIKQLKRLDYIEIIKKLEKQLYEINSYGCL